MNLFIYSIALFFCISKAQATEPIISENGYVAAFSPPEAGQPVASTLAIINKATQKAIPLSMTLATVTGAKTDVAQNSRAAFMLQAASCGDFLTENGDQLSFFDSPTQLTVSDGVLKHHTGAVLANWALLGGTAASWMFAAQFIKAEKLRFPGGLILPVMFLVAPTTGSAVTLLQQGTVTERLIGGCSITAQVLGAGVLAVFLHPSYFKIAWDDKGYNLLFKSYLEGKQWFVDVELLISMATGVLKPYVDAGNNCRNVVTGSAAIAVAYAAALLASRPHENANKGYFYAIIASAQALTLSTQALAMWLASEETQKTVNTASTYILTGLAWVSMAHNLYRKVMSVGEYVLSKSRGPSIPFDVVNRLGQEMTEGYDAKLKRYTPPRPEDIL